MSIFENTAGSVSSIFTTLLLLSTKFEVNIAKNTGDAHINILLWAEISAVPSKNKHVKF